MFSAPDILYQILMYGFGILSAILVIVILGAGILGIYVAHWVLKNVQTG